MRQSFLKCEEYLSTRPRGRDKDPEITTIRTMVEPRVLNLTNQNVRNYLFTKLDIQDYLLIDKAQVFLPKARAQWSDRRVQLVLDSRGSFLGMEKGCFIIKDNLGEVKRYPLFEKEIEKVVLKCVNMVSTGALLSLGFWGINVLVQTQRGRPVAMFKSLITASKLMCETMGNGEGAIAMIFDHGVKGLGKE